MKKLAFLDSGFLYAETPNTPMHIAGLQVFEVPAHKRPGFFEAYRRNVAERLHSLPFLTRRLARTELGIDHPVLVTDERFNLDYHVRHTAIPRPGTQRQLEALVARLHERPLDRSRPLWEFWIIEGLEGDRIALYTKYHHAVIDGMAGQAIIDFMMGYDPERSPEPLPPSEPDPYRADELWGDTLRSLVEAPWRNARAGAKALGVARKLVGQARGGGLGALGGRVPAAPFNKAVGPHRIYAAGTLPLPAVKAVAKGLGVKLNDVFMAVCGGALRQWLCEKNALPRNSLIAGAPVSLRAPGDKSMNNQVTLMISALGTDVEDPIARLETVARSAAAGKGVTGALAGVSPNDFVLPWAPAALRGLSWLGDRTGAGNWLAQPVNVVVSNVPGPRQTVYLCGARMLTHWPVSIPAHGQAMNITVQSYLDRLDFAVTACRDVVPDAHRLRDLLHVTWVELAHRAVETRPELADLLAEPGALAVGGPASGDRSIAA